MRLSFHRPGGDILAEQEFKHRADERLNEKQLGEESEREIEAHQLQPICEQCYDVEPLIIGVVQKRGDEAHGGAHQSHCCADDGGLKQNRMGGYGIKDLAGQFERGGTAHDDFQQVGEAEFCQYHCPDRNHFPAEHDAALCVDGSEDAGLPGHCHEDIAVDDIQAVKDISVNRDHHGEECEYHSLKLISWHDCSPL